MLQEGSNLTAVPRGRIQKRGAVRESTMSRTNGPFDPETLVLLKAVFEDACARIRSLVICNSLELKHLGTLFRVGPTWGGLTLKRERFPCGGN